MTIENTRAGGTEAGRQPDLPDAIASEAERVVDPLAMYMRTLVGQVRSNCADLTNRQMALLLVVYMIDERHTVRSLARHLEIAKPVVSRALDKLNTKGYVSRTRGIRDRRDVFFNYTAAGAAFLERFAGRIA